LSAHENFSIPRIGSRLVCSIAFTIRAEAWAYAVLGVLIEPRATAFYRRAMMYRLTCIDIR
jgi:hypothetical protein